MFPFARKQNMNLRPIEQIRFPRKGNMLFTENLTFENYVEFCRQNNANSQAVCHIPYKNITHTAQPTTPLTRSTFRPAAAPRPEADCGAAAACVNGSGRHALLFILRFSNLAPLKARIFTLLSLLICARLRAAAHCKATAPRRGLSCAPLQTRPRGTPRILLAWQRVCKRRSRNAAGECGGRRTRIRS